MTKSPTIGKDGKEYPLTPKQHAFVNAYRETGNASEAYRRAYSAGKMGPDSIKVAASRLLDNPRVAERLRELEERTKANVALTADWFIERLVRRADAAEAAGKIAEANGADNLATKLLGLQIDKVDQTVRQATPADLKPDMREILSGLRHKAMNAAPHMSPAEQESTSRPEGSKLTH